MKTVTIQIGNSDDKLSQKDWAGYVEDTRVAIENSVEEIHFFGGSPNWYQWQNVAWVVTVKDIKLPVLRADLRFVHEQYKQDAVAWTEGETLFV